MKQAMKPSVRSHHSVRENNLPGRRFQRKKRLILTLGVIATQGLMGLYAQRGIRELSEQEIMDLMVGSSIQATRGNDSARMIKRMKEAIADGKKFMMISVEDLPDSWNVVVPCGVGGGEMWESVTDRLKKQNAPVLRNTALRAVRFLSEYMGKEFNALIRNEPAQSTRVALLTAAELGIPIVDACLSGRARPEVQQQTPFVQGIPSYPVSFVTTWGDRIIIDRAVDDYRVEDLSRAIAIASGGGVWMAMNAMSGETTKKCVIKNNLSQAILFGRTVREACENGQDPIAALVRVSYGYRLFDGIVVKAEHEKKNGFTWSNVELEGRGDFEGHTYRIFVKNENILSWFDGNPDVMPPDLICNLDPKTGDALPGWNIRGYPLGTEVAMVGIPASDLWRSAAGIEVMGPRHFGFDLDYIPIEELQRNRKQGGISR